MWILKLEGFYKDFLLGPGGTRARIILGRGGCWYGVFPKGESEKLTA